MKVRAGFALAAAVAATTIAACDGPTPSSASSACGTSSAMATPSTCGTTDALWVASDYSSSAVGAMSTSVLATSTAGRVDLGADPALAVSRGRAFYVARELDTVFELDPGCGTPMARFSAHVGTSSASSDPYDVGVARDGSLWIPLYLAAKILVLTPGCEEHFIDLSSYDTDHNPDAMGIAIVDTPAGEKAFVPLQRLNPYPKSTQPSWMLRIDVATARVEATIVLAGRNPFGMSEDAAGMLWLAEPGNFDDATEPLAGVERFDTSTSTTSLVVHEADLGGSVAEVAVTGGCGVAIAADATAANATSLVTFDATTGSPLLTAAHSPLSTGGPRGGLDLEGLSWLQGDLFVGDRRRASDGYPVHRLAAAGCTLTTQPDRIFLPLPPVAIRAP